MAEQRLTIDVAPVALIKIIAAIAIVWVWLRVWELFMIVLVAAVVAIGLEPLVERLERRGFSRGLAATCVVGLLTAIIVGFFWISGESLAGEARQLSGRISAVLQQARDAAPSFVRGAIARGTTDGGQAATGYVFAAGGLVLEALVGAALVLILSLYLLVEGGRTYRWLAAYAPPSKRERVLATAVEARKAIYAYIVGNAATSLFAATVVFVGLTLLRVPAALLLAILAGVFDFVPVAGFFCAAVPAILLALTKSPGVAIAVAALYLACHAVENYYLGPRVYGDRLKLSNLAVILAFAVGAAIGGVGGALLALPLAALYPVVEHIWLRDYLSRGTVETHQQLQRETAQ